jgi:hypothetical protein
MLESLPESVCRLNSFLLDKKDAEDSKCVLAANRGLAPGSSEIRLANSAEKPETGSPEQETPVQSRRALAEPPELDSAA